MHSFVKKLSIAIIITGILLVPFHFLIAEEQKTPIIILHGIGASVNWQQMTNKGTDSWGFVPFVNHYDQLIESLENNGYVQNQDLFIVYYDWRQSNILSATEYLEPIIYEALDNSSTDKVHIVAHSMGGLVARSYLEYSFGPKVSKFIMLGTPNYGSGDIYVLQEAGEKPDSYSTALQNIIDFYLWYLRIVDDEITDDFLSVQQHIQSAKELMPIYDYLKDSTTQEIIPYSTHSENEGTLSRNIFLEQLNETDNIQQMVDQTDEIHIIAGTNQETLHTIPVTPDDDPNTEQWTDGIPFPNPPELDSLEGDGTVPLVSARIDDPCLEPRPDPIFQAYQYIKNIIGFPTAHAQLFCGYYTEEEYQDLLDDYLYTEDYPITHHEIESTHGELPTTAIPLIFDILELGDPPTVEEETIFQRILQFWIGSPVTVDITAPDGTMLSDIPNVTITSSGGDDPVQIISIPEPQTGEYQLTITGTDTGDYHIGTAIISETEHIIQTIEGETNLGEEALYAADIPAQAETFTQEEPTDLIELSGSSTEYEITFSKGWNLFSIPSTLSDPSIELFLSEIINSTESIWTYDTEWEVYRPDTPELNSLTTLTPGYGYWLNYTNDNAVTLSKEISSTSTGPTPPPSRVLSVGWNLVGTYHFLDTSSQALDSLFETIPLYSNSVVTYTNTSESFSLLSPTDSVLAGSGYWLFIPTAADGPTTYSPTEF